MSGQRTCQVGMFVLVEVEAYPQEASIVAECACNFPGDWIPRRDPVEVTGELNGKPVTARILRSEALMVKVKDE